MDRIQFKKNKFILGFTTGVYDLFHIGHLNLLRSAKSLCDKLIVGVSTDELVQKNKNKLPVIPFNERREIIQNIKYVDAVIAQDDDDKFIFWEKLKFDILFVGDDWYRSNKWKNYEKKFKKQDVKVIYFPYTQGTSSTKINKILDSFRI